MTGSEAFFAVFTLLMLAVYAYAIASHRAEDRSKWIALDEWRTRTTLHTVHSGKVSYTVPVFLKERLYELPDKSRVWRTE